MGILVVDDVAVHRDALAEALGREPLIGPVEIASDCVVAERQLSTAEGTPIVLLDLGMRDSIHVLRRLGAIAPVIVVSVPDTDDEVIACAEAGAAGLLLRHQPLPDLVALVSSVRLGETRCSPRVTATLLRHVTRLSAKSWAAPAPRLTPREQEVLELIEQGLSNKQIARRLFIELRTAKNHVHHILEKYEVHRRADAAERYRAAVGAAYR